MPFKTLKLHQLCAIEATRLCTNLKAEAGGIKFTAIINCKTESASITITSRCMRPKFTFISLIENLVIST